MHNSQCRDSWMLSNLSVVRESPYTFLPPTVTRVSPMLMAGAA
jgi:hypothetical protein